MKIFYVTAGSGGEFYCENCLRDQALIRAQLSAGHQVTMIPFYLPVTLEKGEPLPSSELFYGGVDLYLKERVPLLRKAPAWIGRLLNARWVLRLAAGASRLVEPSGVAHTTVSMLRGEGGDRGRELGRLIEFIRSQGPPDVLCLSNALLSGIVPALKSAFSFPVLCSLQGEHTFLDAFPEPERQQAWALLSERARLIDRFIAASFFYRDYMAERLCVPPERISVVYNGISSEGDAGDEFYPTPPVIGFLSRLCRAEGFDLFVEAFLLLRRRPSFRHLRARAAGGFLAGDRAFLQALRRRVRKEGASGPFQFLPHLRGQKRQRFLRSLSLLSVPGCNKAFGLCVLEALSACRPVVLPRSGAFVELVERTGGGILCEAGDPASLAEKMAELLEDPERLRRLGRQGREAVKRDFSIERVAGEVVAVMEETAGGKR